MALFTDDFNRTDAASLGNGWTDAYFFPADGPADRFSILSNKARAQNTPATYEYAGALAPIDAALDWDISVDVTRQTWVPSCGIIARATAADNFYFLYIDATDWVIYKCIAGAIAQLSSGTQAVVWGLGVTKTLRFQIVGSTLKAWIAGTLVATITNTLISSPGTCGLFARVGNTADVRYENFSAESIGALSVNTVIAHELRALSNFNANVAHELLGIVLLDVDIASVASMDGWVESVVKVPHLLRAERNFDSSPAHQAQQSLISLVVDAVISHALRGQVQFDAVIAQEGKRYSDWTLESGLSDTWTKEAAPSDTWAKDGALADSWSKE